MINKVTLLIFSNIILGDINDDLRCWAARYLVSDVAVRQLHKILKKHIPGSQSANCLIPKAPALIKDEENFVFIGIEEQLKRQGVELSMPLNLEVNIDGMSVTKSSKSQIWPILVSVKEQGIEPALVAAYIGKEKPDPAILLNDFVDEMSTLMSRSSGFRRGNVSFTCDLPAKKMVKCCSSYTSYGSCDYCVVRGEHYKGRRIFLDQNAVLRTNEQFRSHVDRNVHTSNSPLLPLLSLTICTVYVLVSVVVFYFSFLFFKAKVVCRDR